MAYPMVHLKIAYGLLARDDGRRSVSFGKKTGMPKTEILWRGTARTF